MLKVTLIDGYRPLTTLLQLTPKQEIQVLFPGGTGQYMQLLQCLSPAQEYAWLGTQR